jgi:hypothetical protein
MDLSPGQSQFNSPVVAMWNFLNAALLSAPAPFFEQKVPMEAIYISPSGDQYRNYGWPQISGWGPNQFAQYFVSEHKKANKSLRVSALALPGSAAYQTAVNTTKGKYYSFGSSSSVDLAIQDYAEQVILHAFIQAKRRISLTKTPSDVATIKVLLAGVELLATQWKYDAATNSVEIFWEQIDQSGLKPGDRLVIRYR